MAAEIAEVAVGIPVAVVETLEVAAEIQEAAVETPAAAEIPVAVVAAEIAAVVVEIPAVPVAEVTATSTTRNVSPTVTALPGSSLAADGVCAVRTGLMHEVRS